MPTDNPLDYLYPEDPTGSAAQNKIVDEYHVVTPAVEPGDYNIIFPKMSPYFLESMKIWHPSSNRYLDIYVDWAPGHLFASASYELEWVRGGLYGSILILNRDLTGQFRLEEYNTLGGAWNLDETTILDILANRRNDPRTVTYEVVSGKPEVYPPSLHPHPSEDFIGFAEAVLKMGDIEQAIRERTQEWLENPPILMGEYVLRSEAGQLVNAIISDQVMPSLNQSIAQVDAKVDNLAISTLTGLTSRYTKAESDNRYYLKSQVYTKAETDSRYYLKSQTYARSEMDNRYRQLSGTASQVYITDGSGTQTTAKWATAGDANTIARRDANGRLSIADATSDSHAVSRAQLTTVASDRYTKSESNSRYYLKSETYTRTQMDDRYMAGDAIQLEAIFQISAGGALSMYHNSTGLIIGASRRGEGRFRITLRDNQLRYNGTCAILLTATPVVGVDDKQVDKNLSAHDATMTLNNTTRNYDFFWNDATNNTYQDVNAVYRLVAVKI